MSRPAAARRAEVATVRIPQGKDIGRVIPGDDGPRMIGRDPWGPGFPSCADHGVMLASGVIQPRSQLSQSVAIRASIAVVSACEFEGEPLDLTSGDQ